MSPRLAALGPNADDPSPVLYADATALGRIVALLRHIGEEGWTIELGEPPIEGGPVLRRLELRASTTAVTISCEDDALVIRGDPAHLHRLAGELNLYLAHNDLEEPGTHCRIDRADYGGDAVWIAPESAPLMVAGWVPESE